MKVCEKCGVEFGGKDGENRCEACEACDGRRKGAARQRRERESIMRDLGLIRVRGAMGGTYWE